MNYKIFLSLAILSVFVFTSMNYVQAFPQPNLFYGTVTINGVPAPDGVLISAQHQGKDVGGALTEGGEYFLTFALESTEHGDTIELYIQGTKGGEGTFSTGTTIHEVDLSATIPNFCGDGKCESGESCSSCPGDCGTCESGGNGGGGNGGNGGGIILPPSEEEEEEGTCVEDWMCTDWTECFNSRQNRVCADVNRCGTEDKKPVEVQNCVMQIVCEPDERMCRENVLMLCSSTGTTWVDLEECEFGCYNGECLEEGGIPLAGMLAGLPAMAGAIAGVIVIIVILAFYFVKIRK